MINYREATEADKGRRCENCAYYSFKLTGLSGTGRCFVNAVLTVPNTQANFMCDEHEQQEET